MQAYHTVDGIYSHVRRVWRTFGRSCTASRRQLGAAIPGAGCRYPSHSPLEKAPSCLPRDSSVVWITFSMVAKRRLELTMATPRGDQSSSAEGLCSIVVTLGAWLQLDSVHYAWHLASVEEVGPVSLLLSDDQSTSLGCTVYSVLTCYTLQMAPATRLELWYSKRHATPIQCDTRPITVGWRLG